jgi:5'-nucleotidase/UDP-sugar diphosphatase
VRKKQRIIRCKVLILGFVGLLFACGASQRSTSINDPAVHHLVVLHTNDNHGHCVKFTYKSEADVGGLPARATLIKQIKKENDCVLLLDAGDLNTGTAVSDLFKAEPDILGYNAIGYDAMALGNHEFDNPAAVLREQMAMADFPFLSANIRTRDGAYLAQPYLIKEFPGFKVAIFGLTTKETAYIGNPAHVRDLVFLDEVEVAQSLVPQLKEQADVVIALVHMGLFQSAGKGSKRLASAVDGIDLIVDGHSHTRLQAPVFVKNESSGRETPIVQAWKWGLELGRVDLEIQDRKVVDLRFEAIPMNLIAADETSEGIGVHHFKKNEIEEDPALLTLLQPYIDEADARMSQVVGYAEGTFFSDEVRQGETPLGDLVADSMLWFTRELGVDFAIQNGGGIRADLPQGPITMKQVYEMLPFNNSIVVLDVKGSDVQSLFDYMAAISPGQGAFSQISEGVRFTINDTRGKCEDVLIHGRPLNPEKIYRIATNSYLAGGGDGYKIFLKALEVYDTATSQREVFVNYIRHLGGTIKPKAGTRINMISLEMLYGISRMAA